MFGDRAEAEEVLQEVFLQVWRRAGDFDSARGRALPWLAMLTRSRGLDRLSVIQSRERLRRNEVRGNVDDSSTDPADEAVLAEEGRRLREALGHIPEAQRRVLMLAYFGGLSQSEIARQLGTPLGTVKSHARLGLLKLRELLRSRPPGGPIGNR